MTLATGGGPGESGTVADRTAQQLMRDVLHGRYRPGEPWKGARVVLLTMTDIEDVC